MIGTTDRCQHGCFHFVYLRLLWTSKSFHILDQIHFPNQNSGPQQLLVQHMVPCCHTTFQFGNRDGLRQWSQKVFLPRHFQWPHRLKLWTHRNPCYELLGSAWWCLCIILYLLYIFDQFWLLLTWVFALKPVEDRLVETSKTAAGSTCSFQANVLQLHRSKPPWGQCTPGGLFRESSRVGNESCPSLHF